MGGQRRGMDGKEKGRERVLVVRGGLTGGMKAVVKEKKRVPHRMKSGLVGGLVRERGMESVEEKGGRVTSFSGVATVVSRGAYSSWTGGEWQERQEALKASKTMSRMGRVWGSTWLDGRRGRERMSRLTPRGGSRSADEVARVSLVGRMDSSRRGRAMSLSVLESKRESDAKKVGEGKA